MTDSKFELVTNEVLELFELFDWWQPARLSEETGIKADRIKYLLAMRKEFKKHQDQKISLNQKQLETVESFSKALSLVEADALKTLLPTNQAGEKFTFIDLFAGIGGIRKPFEEIGGKCILTCEWDEYAQKTYNANWKNCAEHQFVSDIKSITQPKGLSGKKQINHIDQTVPAHSILLAGFPCQPFSIAGVSKKNSLNRSHGFECQDQGQLFFDLCRILSVKQPEIAILENVKNLKSHNKGTTFQVITEMLTNLAKHQVTLFGKEVNRSPSSYWIANLTDDKPDPKIVNAKNFISQNRERIILVCVRSDLVAKYQLDQKIDLRKIEKPEKPTTLEEILDKNNKVDKKYTLTPKLWSYLENYADKHKSKGNGFGYGMVFREKNDSIARTLSARYYKDGSEILINQDDINKNPRRLTPQECARLMGFVSKHETFKIPVSDTRAYKQFGNSVVVPVFRSVAKLLEPYIEQIIKN